jgi:hypothetical protein
VNVSGTPQLTLETGSSNSIVNYISGSGTNTLTFDYTVVAGDTSSNLDYVNTSSLTLNSGTIKDASNNDSILTLPSPGDTHSLGSNKSIVIDTIAPNTTITINSITTDSGISSTDFITNDNNGLTINATLSTILLSGEILEYSNDNGLTWNDKTSFVTGTAIQLVDNTLTSSNTIKFRIIDTAGNSGLVASQTITIDTATPTITSFSTTTTTGYYKEGTTIPITANISETILSGSSISVTLNTLDIITLTAPADGTTMTGTYIVSASTNISQLEVTSFTIINVNDLAGNSMTSTILPAGSNMFSNKIIVIDTVAPILTSFTTTTAAGNYKSGRNISITANISETILSGSSISVTLNTLDDITLTAPADGTTMTGIYIVSASTNISQLEVSSFVIKNVSDLAGNSMTNTTIPSGSSNMFSSKVIVIDTIPPTIISFTMSDYALKIGDTSYVYIEFSEAVTNFSNSNVTIPNGTLSTLTTSDGGINWTAIYTPKSNITAPTNVLTINNTYTDLAGNAGSSISTSIFTIDTLAPTITSFTTTTATGYYKVGAIIPITANTLETIVSGSSINVTLNTSNIITLTASADGTTMIGTYTVSTGNNTSKLAVSSFTIINVSDLAGNNMISTTVPNGSNMFSSKVIVIDTTAPIITSFTTSKTTGNYKAGVIIPITANTSETIVSGSSIIVTLNTSTTIILTASVNGTTMNGTYTVSAGDNISQLAVSSFMITNVSDLAGNNMTNTTIPNGSSNMFSSKVIVIDTIAPTISINTLSLSWGSNLNTVEASASRSITATTTGVENDQIVTFTLNSRTYTGTISSNIATATISSTYLQALTNGTTYTVTANVSDLAGNAAIQASTSFTVDFISPTLLTSYPVNNNKSISISSKIILTFSDIVYFGLGSITIWNNTTGVVYDTITSSKYSGSGTTKITVTLNKNLINETKYYIKIGSDVFKDINDNYYNGISNNYTLVFTTVIIGKSGSRITREVNNSTNEISDIFTSNTDSTQYAVGLNDSNNKYTIASGSAVTYNPLLTLTNTGNMTLTGDITCTETNVVSDIRIKENIYNLENVLPKINKLRGVYYNLKADTKKHKYIGFIAQEIENDFPELVNFNDNLGIKTVNYAQFTSVLLEGMKEMTFIINNLSNKIEKLENELKELKELK